MNFYSVFRKNPILSINMIDFQLSHKKINNIKKYKKIIKIKTYLYLP